MAKTATEINAEANLKLHLLKEERKRMKAAYKAGGIDNGTHKQSMKTLDRSVQSTINEREDALRQLRISLKPNPQEAINAAMIADIDRRNMEKFMEAAGPA